MTIKPRAITFITREDTCNYTEAVMLEDLVWDFGVEKF
jgi:hypothetical protein